MSPISPAPQLVARFGRDLAALAGTPASLAMAVSGGPDSLALLLLAVAALPGRVRAATVDHGLRPESTAEALRVQALCRALDCPHDVLPVTVLPGGDGLQAEARGARYRALSDWAAAHGLTHLATAHHLDDQAETLLMRLQRGSGVAGLAAIRPVRREGEPLIVRPLLGWTKAELVGVVAAAGIEPVDDPSNRDPRFDRTSARRLLAANPELDPVALARSADALREAEESLAWTVDFLWAERVSQRGETLLLAPEALPAELKRRLVTRILSHFDPAARPRGEQLGRLIETLERREPATLSGVKCSGGAVWRFETAPPRRGEAT